MDAGRIQSYISGFVFLNSIGNVWSEPSFLSLIKRITVQLNKEAAVRGTEQIEDFCPHMARHTYTSLAYSAGADIKAVSEILGHASTSVTLDTYTHLTEEKKETAGSGDADNQNLLILDANSDANLKKRMAQMA